MIGKKTKTKVSQKGGAQSVVKTYCCTLVLHDIRTCRIAKAKATTAGSTEDRVSEKPEDGIVISSECVQIGIDLIVQTRVCLIAIIISVSRSHIVVRGCVANSCIGSRKSAQQSATLRRNQRIRNDTAAVLCQIAGRACSIQAGAANQCGGHVLLQACPDLLARPLIVQEVKGFVLEDRTTDRSAKLAVQLARDELTCHWIRRGLTKRITRLQRVATAEQKCIAV